MSVHDILFWFFSLAMLLSGVLVITNRNPVNSAMFLILLFFFMAGLFVLLEAFFLAAIQVLVYAGAVMVLFLFVIMLLDLKASSQRKFRVLAILGAFIVAGAFVWELGVILDQPFAMVIAADGPFRAGVADVVTPLFLNYMLPFQLTALLLLVSMVGVVLLSKKELK